MNEMNIDIASTFYKRFKGLMFKSKINLDYGLFFPNTNRIHTCFMLEEITVIYIDKEFNVLDVERIKPWRLGKKVKKTSHIIEMSKEKYETIGRIKKISIKMEG